MDAAMLIAPGCFSSAAISGTETFMDATRAGALGRIAVSSSLGRDGWELASCTILGRSGKILGGSDNEGGWIKVCRGCVGCKGEESIVCLG